jgi:hypothetical protein
MIQNALPGTALSAWLKDYERVRGRCAVGLAMVGDHPQFTNRLQEWFSRRVAELKEMRRIK